MTVLPGRGRRRPLAYALSALSHSNSIPASAFFFWEHRSLSVLLTFDFLTSFISQKDEDGEKSDSASSEGEDPAEIEALKKDVKGLKLGRKWAIQKEASESARNFRRPGFFVLALLVVVC